MHVANVWGSVAHAVIAGSSVQRGGFRAWAYDPFFPNSLFVLSKCFIPVLEGQLGHLKLHLMPILLGAESGGTFCPEEVHGFLELTKAMEGIPLGSGKVRGDMQGTDPHILQSHLGGPGGRVRMGVEGPQWATVIVWGRKEYLD